MIIFDCISSISTSHSFEFWGDIFNYRNIVSISLSGQFVSDNTDEKATEDIWQEIDGYIEGQVDYEDVIINGKNYGAGRLLSIEFELGTDGRRKGYSTEIEIYKEGNLFNLSGDGYDKIDFSNIPLEYIENLSESFSFSENEDNTITYDKSLSFSVREGKNIDTVAVAKNLANVLMVHSPDFDLINCQYPDFYESSGRRITSERYDEINHSFSFDENFISSSNGDPYTWIYNIQFNRGENGISTVTESGTIQGISELEIDSARQGYIDIIGGVFGRVSDVYNFYNSNSSCSLIEIPITRSVNSNECVGIIEYEIQYSDDSRNQGCVTHSYSLSTTRNQDGYYSITESGNIVSKCAVTQEEKKDEVKSYFDLEEANIISRIEESYNEALSFGLECNPDAEELKKSSKEVGISCFEGNLVYSIIYTDNPTIVDSETIASVTKSVSNSKATHLINNFLIPNEKEIAQESCQSNMGQLTTVINIRNKKEASLSELLLEADSRIELPPSGSEYFVVSNTYSWNPIDGNFNFSVTYNYTGYKEYSDILASC